ncbi:amino acid transporter [Colwellia sp. M166]|uniref:LysE/ArgO family amino acid transporter n=1 Tax=Colwellia sp. M166 TaxID=2583805 RepID=UPI00211F370D|nr:LysE/ArgO family amino acid transporter [Colwellia sp. M166]UUO25506.1 amino acid transporter [Colwellia sp. M166]|tara:strand:+ start:16959 stop:17573 length:615 start_codon:yes stop_codon:yes gene_type:complete
MFSPLLQGLFLGAGMIIPIGAQNAHVLNHAIKRHHHFLAASICMFCDVVLIALGVFGGAKLIATSPTLVTVISWGGITFLLAYASLSFRQVWQNNYDSNQQASSALDKKPWLVIVSTLSVTLLNPHVYLDTVMILGSVGGQFQGNERIAFAVGTMLASIIWFYSLAGAAAKMSPWLNQAKVKRAIDIVVGLIMCAIALSLFSSL